MVWDGRASSCVREAERGEGRCLATGGTDAKGKRTRKCDFGMRDRATCLCNRVVTGVEHGEWRVGVTGHDYVACWLWRLTSYLGDGGSVRRWSG